MNKALQLRHDYCACIKLANETDSKKADAELRSDAAAILKELKEICPHEEVVCLRTEYTGSYTMDCDDRHPEDRICLCCGDYESAYKEDFKRLKTVPFTRFEMGYYNKDLPAQMKNPLNYLLSDAKEFALEKGYSYLRRVTRLY